MVAKLLHQTKITILLSLNAVVILIVGIMIFSAINLNGGIEFRVVSERSDVVSGGLEEISLLAPSVQELVPVGDGGNNSGGGGASFAGNYSGGTVSDAGVSSGSVPRGQLWAEDAITMYQTADFDICVGSGLGDLGEMYWQTSDTSVIKGFLNGARTWLGFDAARCRYPVIVGTGTVTITAGTYDGARHDKLTVTVVAAPAEQWKRDVLTLVNQERAKNGLAALSWSSTCEAAADVRAREIVTTYSHTRPDGTRGELACTVPGGWLGENLNVGNAAVSPATVMASWMASADHRANILNPNFTHMAVGFVFDPSSQNKTHWTQIFANY